MDWARWRRRAAHVVAALALGVTGCSGVGGGGYPGTYDGDWWFDVNDDGDAFPEPGTMVVEELAPGRYGFETLAGTCPVLTMVEGDDGMLVAASTTCGSFVSIAATASIAGDTVFFYYRATSPASGAFAEQVVSYQFRGDRVGR